MTALVTGATGFIGSHVLDALTARGVPVRALVRNEHKADELRERVPDVVTADVRDKDAVQLALQGIDVTYHCVTPDLEGVQNLLDASLRTPRCRIVLLTGLSVLGRFGRSPATESFPYRSSKDPDAAAKIEIERLALAYHNKHGLDVTILRPGFVYGPRDIRNLPQLTEAISSGTFIYIGSRHNVVPIVHVSDMVEAMLLAGQAPGAGGRVYHITDGSRTTIKDLVVCLCQLLGRSRPPKYTLPYFLPQLGCVMTELLAKLPLLKLPPPISRDGLLFLGTSRPVDISRAVKELGYTPQVNYRKGMAATLHWMKEKANAHTDLAPSTA
jgi:nucleoside-diphosphate-sugar epimerase